MENNLGIVLCKNFAEEVKSIIKIHNIENVVVSPFTSDFKNINNKKNIDLTEAIKRCENNCNKIIIILENNDYINLNELTNNKEKYKICRFEHYFDLFVNKGIISHFLKENLYLITPGYLNNYEKSSDLFFLTKQKEKIRLLDTGIYENSLEKLQELAEYLDLPYDTFFVGLDFFHMFIEKHILEWKLECENRKRRFNLAIPNSKKYEELKKTKKFVEKKKGQLLSILDSIYEGVFIIDSNYKILFVNKSVERLLNLKDFKSILGKNLFDLGIIHDDYREIILNRFEKVISDSIPVPLIEEKFIQSDGTIIPVNTYSDAIEYEGNLCILSVIRDISEHKQTESLILKVQEQSKLLNEAAEYDKLKTEFFANLSHEFRTPLNVMLSTLQLLNLIGINKSALNNKDKIKKYYAIMKQNCYRLLRLVNNLIDITRIDAEHLKLNLKNENIISIIEDITLSITDYAKNKGLDIIFDTDTEEKIICCDADKIERIILNLLSNAIKFTPNGGSIFVSITDKISSIIVSVKDTGVGIPSDKQDSIFNRFVQIDKSLSRNREGSGIGLSLVKSFVELHNGTIKIISETGKGSEFIIEFPATVLSNNENIILDEDLTKENTIQRFHIEFSDIYD